MSGRSTMLLLHLLCLVATATGTGFDGIPGTCMKNKRRTLSTSRLHLVRMCLAQVSTAKFDVRRAVRIATMSARCRFWTRFATATSFATARATAAIAARISRRSAAECRRHRKVRRSCSAIHNWLADVVQIPFLECVDGGRRYPVGQRVRRGCNFWCVLAVADSINLRTRVHCVW